MTAQSQMTAQGQMKEKLLFLDDELLILTSLEHLFEDDYEVFTTVDAEAALGLAREHDLAVIVCDERMPTVSGHEFLRRAREVSRATRVMISGYADMSALTEAVNSGQILAYVSKPWDPLALMSTVRAAVVHFKLIREIDQERELLRALMENIPDPIYLRTASPALPESTRRTREISGQWTRRSARGRAMPTISNPKTPGAGRCWKKIS